MNDPDPAPSHAPSHAPAHELSVIGSGNMAEAIVRGILSAGLLTPEQIIAADPIASRRALFADHLKVNTSAEPSPDAKIILLSVKPQQMIGVFTALGTGRQAISIRRALFISIAAGITTKTIESQLGNVRVIRAMPNTPMLVGAGMTALSRGQFASTDDLATARRLFECAGKVVEVDESQMEAVTAVSGSGPAYVFYLAEQMIAAGIALGLSNEQAELLALQTIDGAGRMLGSSTDGPSELRRKVTSPGGTTQAAIETMEELDVGTCIRRAISAAAERSREIGLKS